jgi:hypothetical protein
MSEIEQQEVIIKRECYKLYKLLGHDRLIVNYSKEKRFEDIGTLNYDLRFHCYSS